MLAGVLSKTLAVQGESKTPRPGLSFKQGPPVPMSSGQGFECLQGPWDPKGGELYQSTTKPWETAVEVGRCSDVQIV